MRSPLALCLCLLAASPAVAEEWLGRKVFCRPGATAKVGDSAIPLETIPFPATVQAVNGDWLWLGRAWVRKQDALSADQALSVVSAQIRQSPTIAQLWTCRGAIWREKGDDAAAIKDCSEAIRLDPRQAAAFNNRANAWSRQGKYEAAIKDLGEAIRLDPRFAAAYANRGIVWSRLGNHPSAIADFGQAIALDPKDPALYENRGSARGALGDFEDAIKDLTEAIRLDATAAPAYFNRGSAWRAKGDIDRAIKDFSQAIQLDPTDTGALIARGAARTAAGKFEDALKDYDQAIRIDAKCVEAYNARAWLRATAADEPFRDGAAAVDDATQACQLTDWKDGTTLDTLAAAYAEKGEFQEATSWQQKAVELATKAKDLPPADREAIEARLALYQAGEPFREPHQGP